jgi:predicted transposase/invertase (TIGR01784 family)
VEILYSELYGEYDAFKEADEVLQERIMTYTEKAELRGLERGRGEGRAEGREEGKKQVAKNLLELGVSSDVIVKSTGLPIEKIRALMN